MSLLMNKIAEEYGYDDPIIAIEEEGWHVDSVIPGICRKCKTVVDSCEPDARANWCPNCGANAVISIMELMISA